MTAGKRERIYGRNALLEVLRAARRPVYHVRIAEGATIKGSLLLITEMADKAGIPVERVPRKRLDAEYSHHQGVAASVGAYPYEDLHVILARSKENTAAPRLLLLDRIQDPQNLGALLRSAEVFGLGGVVLPLRRAVGVTQVVLRASAGASEHLYIARQNIAQAIRILKKEGFWIAGLVNDPSAVPLGEFHSDGPLALVVGNEGDGLGRLVRESCDYLIKIPIVGRIDSLNASVAGSIAMFSLCRSS